MGSLELFEICLGADILASEDDQAKAAPPPGFGSIDFQLLKTQLFWPSLASASLMCLAILQGFALS